jgi:hypothetical protein
MSIRFHAGLPIRRDSRDGHNVIYFLLSAGLRAYKKPTPVVQAYADILGQDARDHAANISRAWKKWREFEGKYPAVEVYGYTPVSGEGRCGRSE